MKFIEQILKAGTLISAVGFMGSTMIQIYARFFLESAPSWTEELARLFFVYTMSFGAGLAMKDNEFVKLDLVYNKLNVKSQKWLDASVSTLTFLLFLILGVYSIQYISLGMNESSPSLRWNMSISFFSILLMSSSIAFYSFIDSKNKLKAL